MLQSCVCQENSPVKRPLLNSMKTSSPSTSGTWKCTRRSPPVLSCSTATNGSYSMSAKIRSSGCAPWSTWPACRESWPNCGQSSAASGSATRRRRKTVGFTARLRGQGQIAERFFLAPVDLRVVRQPHDLEGLVDDGGEAAEADLAALVDHLLDDLDEDADADGVDDLGLAEVEQERAHAVVHQLVGAIGDLFTADVVDVALGVQNGAAAALALHRDPQFLSHDFFSTLAIWIVVLPPSVGEMSTSSICASMSCRPRPRL